LATLNVLLPFFKLCSARASALVTVLGGSPSEEIGKRETCPALKEDRQRWWAFGRSMSQKLPATLLGLSRETVYKITSLGKTTQRRGTVGENRNRQKETDRHTMRRIVSHTGTSAQVTAEPNTEGPVSIETVRHELQKFDIHRRLRRNC
jgi:hypothetical protein